MLEIKNLTYQYSPKGPMILKGINLHIKQGEFVALIGQNGAGKTTLMKLLNGINKPSGGEVLVAGRNTQATKTSQMAKHIGYLFQNPDHQIFCDTVYEEIIFGLKNQGLTDEEIEQKTVKISKLLNLEHLLKVSPFNLSKGEKQRVALASILALESEILILDEPTTGQDYKECIEIMNIVKQLNEQGTTVVMVSHDMEIVLDYAKRVVVLCDGHIIEDGETAEVLLKKEKLDLAGVQPPQLFEVMIQLQDDFEGAVTPEQMTEVIIRRCGYENSHGVC